MSLKIHFLNVGHGDCTIIELPSGRLMMIDINNSKSLGDEEKLELAASMNMSLDQFKYAPAFQKSFEQQYEEKLVDPADYYQQNLAAAYPDGVFRYIQTHPDMDHMSGLHRFFWQDQVKLQNFWDVAHAKTMDERGFDHQRYAYIDWQVYEQLRAGNNPSGNHRVINRHMHDTGSYWTDDFIEVLSPTPDLIKACDDAEEWNNVSYVFRISWAGRSVILPGDAEAEAWDSMLADAAHVLPCDILKGAHHGRESGHHADAVDVMDPEFVICSVGSKKDVPDASPKYRNQGAKVFSTRAQGTITATISDNGEVTIMNAEGKLLGYLPPVEGLQ